MKALLLTGIHNDLLMKDGAMYYGKQADLLISILKRKLNKYRDSNSLIIYLCETNTEDDPKFKHTTKYCIKNTPGADIIDELEPNDSNNEYIVNKKCYDGFFNTKLNSILERKKADKIEIAGIGTSTYILATMLGAIARGFEVNIDSNAVIDKKPEVHKAAITLIQNNYKTKVS